MTTTKPRNGLLDASPLGDGESLHALPVPEYLKVLSRVTKNGIDPSDYAITDEQKGNSNRKGRRRAKAGRVERPIATRPHQLRCQEPVAIIGVASTFADAPNNEALWQLMMESKEGLKEVPRDRWDVDNYLTATPRNKVIRWANFLQEDIYGFDPLPFGISGTEAKYMDPQQRWALHCAWQALEDAGLPLESIRGSDMGVFVGAGHNEYSRQLHLDHSNVHGFMAAGTSFAVLSNRLSYTWDLRGPSISVDTACSSSLVALHQACQALGQNECSAALVGGVEAMLLPTAFETMNMMGMLAPDGRSKPFTDSCDGFGRGEGVGMLVLKRLEDAVNDGDHIYATIRATHVLQDGAASTPMTNLSVEMQERLMRQTYQRAGIDPKAVQYVEAHGTGTKVGDRVELTALGNVFGANRGKDNPLTVGSVKANVGHNEAAAGVVSLVKVCLMMQHRTIPPVLLHGTHLNANINFSHLHLEINTEPKPWTSTGSSPLCAGVNCFGFGGTIAHAILDNNFAVATMKAKKSCICSRHSTQPTGSSMFVGGNNHQYVFQFSGHTTERAISHMRSVATFLEGIPMQAPSLDGKAQCKEPPSQHAPGTPGSVAYTLACKRSLLPFRIAVTAGDKENLKKQLSDLLSLPEKQLQSKVQKIPEHTPPIVFVFSGMGTQWPQMAADLLSCEPIFRETLSECAKKLHELTHGTIDLMAELEKVTETSRINETQIAQLSIVCVEISLVALWMSWGVQPDAVIGHSLGEIAAAYAAEILSLDDAVILAHWRSFAVSSNCQPGSMLAVNLSAEEATVEAKRHSDVHVACCNSPQSTVLAGSTEQIVELRRELKARDVRCTILKTDIAYHTHYVTEASQVLTAAMEQMKMVHHKPTAAFYSPSSENPQAITSSLPHTYWADNLTQVVKFHTTMEYVLRDYPNAIIIEVSPQPQLLQHVAAISPSHPFIYPSLMAKQSGPKCLATTLARITEKGVRINWRQVFAHDNVEFLRQVPGIQWKKQRYLCDSHINHIRQMGGRINHGAASLQPEQLQHMILQQAIKSRLTDGAHLWQVPLSLNDHPFLGGHRMNGRVILPGMFLLDLCMACIIEISPSCDKKSSLEADKILLASQASLPEHQPLYLEVLVRPPDNTSQQHHVEVRSKDHNKEPYLTGTITYVDKVGQMMAPPHVSPRSEANVTRQEIYKVLTKQGFSPVDAFGTVDRATLRGCQVVGHLSLAPQFQDDAKDFILHPGLLDGCVQLASALRMTRPTVRLLPHSLVNLKVNQIAVADRTRCVCTLTEIEEDNAGITYHLHVVFSADSHSDPAVTGHLRYVFLGEATVSSLFYEHQWKSTSCLPASTTHQQLEEHGDSGHQKSLSEDNTKLCDHALIFNGSSRHTAAAQLKDAFKKAGVAVAHFTVCAMNHETDSQVNLDEKEVDHYQSVLLSSAASLSTQKQLRKLIKVVFICHPHQNANIHNLVQSCLRPLHLLVKAIANVNQKEDSIAFNLLLVTVGAPSIGDNNSQFSSFEDTCLNMIWGYFRSLVHEVLYAVQVIALTSANLFDLLPDVRQLLLTEVMQHYDAKASCYEPELMFDPAKGCLANRFHHVNVPTLPFPESTFSKSATYLIVGGTKGFGLEFAKWLVTKHGVQHLVLCSRSGRIVESKAAEFEQLRLSHDLTALVAACDCTDKDQVVALIAKVSTTMPPLKGIFLSQTVLSDQFSSKQDWPSIEKILSPKVYGSWFFHQATVDIPLDHFMLFSSITSIIGNAGQTAYGAANAFQDALAHYRRKQGLAGTSINLGVLGNTGSLEDNPETAMALYRRGSIMLQLQQVFAAIERIVSNGVAQVLVADINWENLTKVLSTSPSQQQIISSMIAQHSSIDIARSNRQDVLQIVMEGSVKEASLALSKYVITTVAQHLDTTISDIDANTPLENLGFNSMLTVQLIQTIGEDLGVTFLSPQILMESSSANAVVHVASMCKRSLTIDDVQKAFTQL